MRSSKNHLSVLRMITINLFVFLVLILATVGTGFAADIEACITEEWGSRLVPIKIFGRTAQVGKPVKASLEIDGWWSDPLPKYTKCIGFREPDITAISRRGLPEGKILILVRHGGGTGRYPGSAGYVKILNRAWRITRVIANSGLNTDYEGDGIRIDKARGIVRWSGRGGCPACRCHENQAVIAFIVEKVG